MICPQCGSNVSDNDRHCPSCGKLLDKGNIPNKSKTPPILVIGINYAILRDIFYRIWLIGL